jgi:hypothetical protein
MLTNQHSKITPKIKIELQVEPFRRYGQVLFELQLNPQFETGFDVNLGPGSSFLHLPLHQGNYKSANLLERGLSCSSHY